MKEAKLYLETKNGFECQLCNHFCKLSDGQLGVCGVRQNLYGKLISLNYGHLITESVDPIEKKPIFHFLPGSLTYSIATVGCNLRCDNCQNWKISQVVKNKKLPTLRHQPALLRKALLAGAQGEASNKKVINSKHQILKYRLPGNDVSPEEIIDRAIESGCQSISYTYTEPTIFFEFALACMKLAHKNGLGNIWVSNGYMSKQCLAEILPYLDAINVDLKFFDEKIYLKNCGCKLKPILENLEIISQSETQLEITTLLIPGLTDINNQPQKIADFISQKLSKDVPWHITKFSPEISYKLQDQESTSSQLINEVYQIGKQAGLNYVYVGNVLNDKREYTFCPKCQSKIISRNCYQIKRFDNYGNCFKCGLKLPLKIT